MINSLGCTKLFEIKLRQILRYFIHLMNGNGSLQQTTFLCIKIQKMQNWLALISNPFDT